MEKVGVILGRRPATPVDFYVAVDKEKIIRLDDAVFTKTKLIIDGREEEITFYGIVDFVERSYDGLDFDSDMYYIDGIPVEEKHIAHVKITVIEPEHMVAPRPGQPVFLARGDNFQKAIGADKMERKIPAGLSLSTDDIVYLDLDFVNGKKGAHVNISGVSGIATKTSYGIFLLHEIMRHGKEDKYAGIIFNVKGEDLLFIDKPNKEIHVPSRRGEEVIAEWKKLSKEIYERYIEGKMGLSDFMIRFCAPPKRGERVIKPDVHRRRLEETYAFGWSAYTFLKLGIIKYAISEDDSENIKAMIGELVEILRSLADYTKEKDRREKIGYVYSLFGDQKVETYDQIEELVESILIGEKKPLTDLAFLNGNIQSIRSKYPLATRKACMTRMRRIRNIGTFVRPEFASTEEKEKIMNFEDLVRVSPGEINVFHIGSLDETCQRIVVGSILSEIFEQQVREGPENRKVVIFLDELAKYAPREGSSPIKELLEDIAERGRSLGVILIGAQQSARTVSRKIIMNSSIKVAGRLSSEEAEGEEYGFLTRELKMRLLVARPGRMVISQPTIYAPIMVRFPFPFWATREEEVLEDIQRVERKIEEKLKSVEL